MTAFPKAIGFFVILTNNFNLAKRWQKKRTAFMSRLTAAIKINEFKIDLECACECKIQTNEKKNLAINQLQFSVSLAGRQFYSLSLFV